MQRFSGEGGGGRGTWQDIDIPFLTCHANFAMGAGWAPTPSHQPTATRLPSARSMRLNVPEGPAGIHCATCSCGAVASWRAASVARSVATAASSAAAAPAHSSMPSASEVEALPSPSPSSKRCSPNGSALLRSPPTPVPMPTSSAPARGGGNHCRIACSGQSNVKSFQSLLAHRPPHHSAWHHPITVPGTTPSQCLAPPKPPLQCGSWCLAWTHRPNHRPNCLTRPYHIITLSSGPRVRALWIASALLPPCALIAPPSAPRA